MFPNNFPYNTYTYGITPYQVAQNLNLRQGGDQEPYHEMENYWGAVPLMGSAPNNFHNAVMPGGYPDSRVLSWNGFTDINGFPPPNGVSFPPNGFDFASSHVGITSNSGVPDSDIPIPDPKLPADTSPWVPARGDPTLSATEDRRADYIRSSEKQRSPRKKIKTSTDHISPASSDSSEKRSVGASPWEETEQVLASLFGDNTPLDMAASSAGLDLTASSNNPDISFDMIAKLSMEATRLSKIADGFSSTMCRLSEAINELPVTAGKLTDTASGLSQTVALISSKVDGISSFYEGLNERIQQVCDKVDTLSETVGEMTKREKAVMEAFSTINERPGRSQVPFQFQNKAVRKRK